jgi:hypothetical protein
MAETGSHDEQQMILGQWRLCDGGPHHAVLHFPLVPHPHPPEPPRFGSWYNTINVDGTSLRGTVFGVSPIQLIEALGLSEAVDMVETCLEWHFKDTSGRVWALYDRNLVNYYSREEIKTLPLDGVPFFIGGEKDADITELDAFLRSRIGEILSIEWC